MFANPCETRNQRRAIASSVSHPSYPKPQDSRATLRTARLFRFSVLGHEISPRAYSLPECPITSRPRWRGRLTRFPAPPPLLPWACLPLTGHFMRRAAQARFLSITDRGPCPQVYPAPTPAPRALRRVYNIPTVARSARPGSNSGPAGTPRMDGAGFMRRLAPKAARSARSRTSTARRAGSSAPA